MYLYKNFTAVIITFGFKVYPKQTNNNPHFYKDRLKPSICNVLVARAHIKCHQITASTHLRLRTTDYSR